MTQNGTSDSSSCISPLTLLFNENASNVPSSTSLLRRKQNSSQLESSYYASELSHPNNGEVLKERQAIISGNSKKSCRQKYETPNEYSNPSKPRCFNSDTSDENSEDETRRTEGLCPDQEKDNRIDHNKTSGVMTLRKLYSKMKIAENERKLKVTSYVDKRLTTNNSSIATANGINDVPIQNSSTTFTGDKGRIALNNVESNNCSEIVDHNSSSVDKRENKENTRSNSVFDGESRTPLGFLARKKYVLKYSLPPPYKNDGVLNTTTTSESSGAGGRGSSSENIPQYGNGKMQGTIRESGINGSSSIAGHPNFTSVSKEKVPEARSGNVLPSANIENLDRIVENLINGSSSIAGHQNSTSVAKEKGHASNLSKSSNKTALQERDANSNVCINVTHDATQSTATKQSDNYNKPEMDGIKQASDSSVSTGDSSDTTILNADSPLPKSKSASDNDPGQSPKHKKSVLRPPSHLVSDRHYVLHETLPLQEDTCHEFKGHNSVSIFDIPRRCLNDEGASRNSVSA